MFVMATINAGVHGAPVKVRNLSSTGGLVEGARIPDPATKIVLRRGELTVSGTVVWKEMDRAGLKFDAPIYVPHWLPGGDAMMKNHLVDAAFHGSKTRPDSASPATELTSGSVDKEMIMQAEGLLEELANALADDEDIVKRFGAQLQSLDLAIQLLRRLAGTKTNAAEA